VRNTLVAVLSLAALTIAGCVTTAYRPTPVEMDSALREITGQDGRACIRQRDIAGFGALSDTVLSVSDKFRGQYLMITRYSCPGMEVASRALFEGAFTEFCGLRDSIATRDGRCPILSVFTFENRDVAFEAHDQALEAVRARRDSAGSE
jgi:hypothetical protein